MKKLKEWITNGDNIIFMLIFIIAGIIFAFEIINIKSVYVSVLDAFYFDGIFAGVFATLGCLLPLGILTLDGSWIYRSWKHWKW